MTQQQAKEWLTEDRLGRINHMRQRSGKDPMTRQDIEAWLPFWSERDLRELLEAIG